jgi:trigger factor
VPAEEVERQVTEAARQLGRRMRIPGFRKGKVPPPLVIQRLGREAVLDEALRSAIGSWYVDAIEEAGIVPVGEPDLDVGDMPTEGEPLSFSIEIGVRPAARLGRYKGLEVGRREPAVDEEAIDAQVERLRDQLATLDTVERAAVEGDHVIIDYTGSIDGATAGEAGARFEGGSGTDYLLELGSGRLIPGFEEQLIGASAGEERTVQLTFPQDYDAEHLAGRPATFEVKVKEVKTKHLPELDDELAEQAGGFDTLAELREDIAGRLRESDERAIEREYEEAVLDAAVAEASVEVPAKLVHARAHEVLQDTLNALARQGISQEAYLRIAGQTEEELANEAEPQAEQALKREAVLAAVIEAEGIRPSDEQVREALQPAAERSGRGVDEVFEQLRKGDRLERLRGDVARRQAIELLVREAKPIGVEQAKARDKLWTPGKEGAEGSGQIWTPGAD